MLLDSLTNAKDDIKIRAVIEASTEAQLMLDTTEKFMVKHKDLLEPHEQEMTLAQMQKLREAINAQDKDRIQKEQEHLNDISRPYAERVMDAALKDAMKGKKII